MGTILGIESTCDETAAAVVVDGCDVRSNVIASQAELHARYRGVVPEIACRAHIENINPVVREALAESKTSLSQIDAIAVAHRPGLIGSLLIGVTAAKTLAWATDKPLIGIDHVHAHLYSVMLQARQGQASLDLRMPAVGLVVSGGHTALYRLDSWLDVSLIGTTIDDAMGEAYDKVAAILGLGYPGGPLIDRLAASGNPSAVAFPRTYLGRESLDFSFSGLKTAVLYHVRGVPTKGGPNVRKSELSRPAPTGALLADVAASFQAACVDVIVKKLQRAVRHISAKSIVIGGGVSANKGLRGALAALDVPVLLPCLEFCTDNAAMTAGLADLYLRERRFSSLDLDAVAHSQFSDG